MPLKYNSQLRLIFVIILILFTKIVYSAETINYSYDDMDRLTRAEYGDGTVVEYAYDKMGNRLQKRLTVPDTTSPTISSTNPTNGATAVPVNTSISATFSEPMNPSTINTTTFTVSGVTGSVNYTDTTAVFNPSGNLAPSTTYTATITNGVTDVSGNAMASNYTWSFTTGNVSDSTSPTVTSTNPEDGANTVTINTSISATFNESMDATTINTSTFFLSGGGTGTVSYDDTTKTATLKPSSELNISTTYTATITTDVKDLSGNALAADYSWSFTTTVGPDITKPTVTSTNPANGATDVDVNEAITATFSEAMNASTIGTSTFKINGGTGTVSYNSATSEATFTPTPSLQHVTTYTATIDRCVEDLAGNKMASDYSWSFTTMSCLVVITPIWVGETINGNLSASDCESSYRSGSYADKYSFNASSGDMISIETNASFDTYLYLIGPSGSVVAQDDDGGSGLNSRIPPGSGWYTLPSTGTYTIEATSYRSGQTGSYTLSLFKEGLPLAITGLATDITLDSAVLNGTVGPNGTSTTVWFDYGESAYTNSTSAQAVNGTSTVAVNSTVNGLSPETTYVFRIVGQNYYGTSYGSDTSFITTFTHIVTPSAGAGGSISPSTPQTVNHGETIAFTVTSDTGYHIDTVTGCGGTLTGNTYTTGAITADCAVTATFAINTYTVTPSAGAGGSITPNTPQTVNHGSTTTFTITPNTGYHIDTVTGCGGTLTGNTYTTGAITADCAVTATFAIDTHTVTPSAGAGGSISPSTPQTINHGETIAFTVTPDIGYHIDTVTGCGGTLTGNTYTTGPITADCAVTATFAIDCNVKDVAISPNPLNLKKNTSETVTVTLTGAGGCRVEGETVTAKVTTGSNRISVSPPSLVTDENGEATFTITRNKIGKAKVSFEAGAVKKTLTVKVTKK